VTLLSWGFWQRRFGGDRGIVGRTIEINRVPLTVVGVLPQHFAGLTGDAALWVPMGTAPAFIYPEILQEVGNHWHSVVARRKAGVTAQAVKAELDLIGPGIATDQLPESASAQWGVAASPLNNSRVDPALRRSVAILFGAVTFVLLIACA